MRLLGRAWEGSSSESWACSRAFLLERSETQRDGLTFTHVGEGRGGKKRLKNKETSPGCTKGIYL